MRISFYGGVGEVTGSRHLLEAGDANFLLDCGLFQGHRRESIAKNRTFPFPASKVHAVLLSHAHIDHSGSLPLLVKSGFSGPIHCTDATADLCGIMLADSARLQEEDAKFFNKIHRDDGQTIEPLYTQDDVAKTLRLFTPHPYEKSFSPAKGVQVQFLNAGHVLGSAMIEVTAQTPAGQRRLLYTGDLGRQHALLMKPPRAPKNVDYLLIESTYGNRVHEPIPEAEQAFKTIIESAIAQKGKVLIPSFALERTQEIVFILEKLRREGRIPSIPLYVDSPMAVSITEVFNRHLDCFCFDPEFKAYVAREGDPFGFESVRYVRSPDDSRHLNDLPGPMIILSASGMCEGGRILHHLRNNIGKTNTIILMVGYQAEGTLGRRLVERAAKVKIFGLEHRVEAEVRSMPFFSAHADQNDLLHFIRSFQPAPRKIFLVHGDREDREVLTSLLRAQGATPVESPAFNESFELT